LATLTYQKVEPLSLPKIYTMHRSIAIISALIVLNLHQSLNAQLTGYWQQNVDYDISVTLNDVNHTLTGNITMLYTNNSPDELTFIWMHLWPNAYKDNQTAFAKQKVLTGSTDFYFAKDDERGYIDNLEFSVNGTVVPLTYDAENPDIAKITLFKPIASGETVSITTPFRVQIPKCFSRMGRVGQQYQMTQWYPKPAVYDKKGWHPIPYLDQGEFYSEFGNFKVQITLPENYIVGASGDLKTAAEFDKLNALADKTAATTLTETSLDFPPSSTTTKTLQYELKNSHDFAWFADKRFHVMRSSVVLPESERTVLTYVYFTNQHKEEWIKACDYVNRSVLFYSENVGEYPWNIAQAVDGTLEVESAGGMEYPTITVLGGDYDAESLDNVVTHEVGHNWFYGIIGSNEREHPWMDEGINSYYENRYMDAYYNRGNALGLPTFILDKLGVDTNNVDNVQYHMYQTMARQNKAQAINLHSTDYTMINYGVGVYLQSAYIMKYLEDNLGTDEFDRIMRKYYKTYQFKHVYPEDMKALFEAETGENFAWFFDMIINDALGPDYKISKFQKGKTAMAVDITNKSEIPASFSVSLMEGDSVLRTDWFRGFTGSQTLYFNYKPEWNVTHLKIDAQRKMPESERENNTIQTAGIFKTIEPLQVKFIVLGVDNPDRTTVTVSPILGWNENNKFMLGLGLWNAAMPTPAIDFVAAPMYAFGTSELVGQGSIGYNLYPKKGFINRLRIAESVSSYSYGTYQLLTTGETTTIFPQYLKLQSKAEIDFRKKVLSNKLSHSISYRNVFIRENDAFFSLDDNGDFVESYANEYMVNEVAYYLKSPTTLFPQFLKVVGEMGDDYTKLSLTYNTKIHYPGMTKGIDVRLFAGAFLGEAGDDKHNFTLAGNNGYYDDLYDEIYLGRNTSDRLLANQISLSDGFFKVPVYNYGLNSDNMLAAGNFEFAIPKVPLIGLFADVAYVAPGTAAENLDAFQYDAGVMIRLPKNIFAIYFPLVMSANLADAFDPETTTYSDKISFMLSLNTLNIFEIIRKLEF